MEQFKREFSNILVSFLREEAGQDLLEYVFLVALIALACVAGEQGVATSIITAFGKISGDLNADIT